MKASMRALLATSSMAALMVASSGSAPAGFDCGGDVPAITGSSAGYTNPVSSTIRCIFFNNATVTGNAVNAGTISSGGQSGGITVLNGTFTGAIVNTGTMSLLSGTGIEVSGTSKFAGSITNTGTIAAGTRGISIVNLSTFTGGITNSGTITAPLEGIYVNQVSTFLGGVTNSGLISAGTGISVFGGLMFANGIINSGTISASQNGIALGTSLTSQHGPSTFTGGITNTGTINAGVYGILVNNLATFSGGISNSGVITTTTGINHPGIAVGNVTLFAGDIRNSGTITSPGTEAISISAVKTVIGNIINSGAISTGLSGITLFASTFLGGITNSGTISAGGLSNPIRGTGIFVAGSSFAGGIINNGRIAAFANGILVSSVVVFGGTSLGGGITNTGTIAARTGIAVSSGGTFSGAIANSGNITGTTAAIDVSNAPNAMTINQMGGTITGAVKLSGFADNLNISGGTINGNIVGQGAGNNVNFVLGAGTFTYGSAFAISGVHQINVNSGLVILDGSNSTTNVMVNGGTLEVGDAAHTGAVLTATGSLTVGPGGTLSGHGTVAGNIAVPLGATLAPGGSIGTLNVTGNLGIAVGSFYQVEVNGAGAASKTAATGAATIAGGTVVVQEQPGTYTLPAHTTILTANTGVTGTFAGAVSELAFLTPTLGYDADDVFLTLTRNPTGFTSQAQTFNQRGVGGALDASPLGSALVQAVGFLAAADARQAYDALSGELHASLQTTLVDDSRFMRQAMLARLRQASYAQAAGPTAALGFAGPVAVSGSGEEAALAYAGTPYPVKAPPAAPPRNGSDLTFWAQALGAWGRIGSDGNAAALHDNLVGMLTGFDARFGDWGRAGIAAGYTHTSLNIDAVASSAGVDTAHLGAYAGTQLGVLSLRAGAAYAWHTIDTTRMIIFPGFVDQATARYDGGTGQVLGEVACGFALGGLAVEPFAGLAYVHVDTNGFSEAGGAAALIGGSVAEDVGYSSLGLRVATTWMLQNGMALVPRFSAGWQHAFGDVTPAAALAFQSTGAAFATTGLPLARDQALVETGVDLRVSPQIKLGVLYSGELAGRLQDHAVKGNFTWNF